MNQLRNASRLSNGLTWRAPAYLVAAVIAVHSWSSIYAERVSAIAPDVVIHDGPVFRIAQQTNEPAPTAVGELPAPVDCKPFNLEPLSSLSVDISPIDQPGQITLGAERPQGCFSYVLGEPPAIFLGGEPRGPDCDLLRICCGWQFCHRPLYFEERCLERYGCRTCCCQPAASALHFYGTALLLPIKMIRQPCCRASVRTPCY
jgi:hypothetical protein